MTLILDWRVLIRSASSRSGNNVHYQCILPYCKKNKVWITKKPEVYCLRKKKRDLKTKKLHIENATSVLKWKYEYLFIFACVAKKTSCGTPSPKMTHSVITWGGRKNTELKRWDLGSKTNSDTYLLFNFWYFTCPSCFLICNITTSYDVVGRQHALKYRFYYYLGVARPTGQEMTIVEKTDWL